MTFPAFEKQFGQGLRERLALYEQTKLFRDPQFHPAVAPPPREVKR